MFDIEKIFEPKTLNEALVYLNEVENSMVICGGSDVLIKNREGKLRGLEYVSIRELKDLHGIYIDDEDNIVIGAASTFTTIENNEIIKKYCPYLSYAVGQVGGPQIRNIGTIGGNLCNGATSADSATSIVILQAKLHLQSVAGVRIIDINDFYVSAGKTVRERDEILTKIVIPKDAYYGYYGMYTKYAMRKAMDIATLGVAMKAKIEDNIIVDLNIAYGVLSATPIRAYNLEKYLIGEKCSSHIMDIIDEHYLDDINPRSSWRASSQFRKKIANEILKRSISKIILKSGGNDVYSC